MPNFKIGDIVHLYWAPKSKYVVVGVLPSSLGIETLSGEYIGTYDKDLFVLEEEKSLKERTCLKIKSMYERKQPCAA